MRTLIILFSLLLTCNLKTLSQNDSDVVWLDNTQDLPRFPGGYDSLWCVLENNFKYDILNSDQKSITFIITFMVDSLGESRYFKCASIRPRDIILNHADSMKMQEIFRVLALLPRWEPAKQMNVGISTGIMIPIKTPYTEFRCNK